MKTNTLDLHHLTNKIKRFEFNWLLYFLVLIFFSGLIFGSVSIKNPENIIDQRIIDFYSEYLHNKNGLSIVLIFLYTLLISFVPVMISFFVGLCAVGIPFISAVPFVVGIIIGIISGYLYESYLLKGLGYCATIVFPSATVACSGIIMSCKESILMSRNMLSLLAMGRGQHNRRFSDYCIRYLIYTALCMLSALIQAVMYNIFSGLFIF